MIINNINIMKIKCILFISALGLLSLPLKTVAQTDEGVFKPEEIFSVKEGYTAGSGELVTETPNISIFVGKMSTAGWKVEAVGDGNYYWGTQNAPKKGNNNADGEIPDAGCYYKLQTHVNGVLNLRIYVGPGTANGNLYALKEDGSYVEGTKAETSGNPFEEVTNQKGGKCIKITEANKKYIDVYIPVASGEIYYIYISDFDKMGLSGYGFDIEDTQVVDPRAFDPVWLHKYVNTATMRMMFGGWLPTELAREAETVFDYEDAKEKNLVTSTYNQGNITDTWKQREKHETTIYNPTDDNQKNMYVPGCAKTEDFKIDDYNMALDEDCNEPDANKGVEGLPCRGTYYKFEPVGNGNLTVYLVQKSGTSITLVDEDGTPVAQQEGNDHRSDYNSTITANEDKTVFTLNGTENQYACWYTWNLKAGKTYFLFSPNGVLGLYSYSYPDVNKEDEKLQLTEDKPYNVTPVDFTKADVQRTINPGVWNAICLPFAMNSAQVRATFGDDTEIAVFKNMEKKFSTGAYMPLFHIHYYQIINAGLPILIKPSNDNNTIGNIKGSYTWWEISKPENESEDTVKTEHTIDIPYVTVTGQEAKSITMDTDGEYTLKGIYSSETMPANSYVFGLKQGQDETRLFYTTDESTQIKGFRAYISHSASCDNQNVLTGMIVDNGGNATYIMTATGKEAAGSEAQGVYSLSGVRVADSPAGLAKGVYITGGRKIIVK